MWGVMGYSVRKDKAVNKGNTMYFLGLHHAMLAGLKTEEENC